MTIKQYISSGILELYALGLLHLKEERKVAANLKKYPALRHELDQIEQALEKYILLHKEKIESRLDYKINEPEF